MTPTFIVDGTIPLEHQRLELLQAVAAGEPTVIVLGIDFGTNIDSTVAALAVGGRFIEIVQVINQLVDCNLGWAREFRRTRQEKREDRASARRLHHLFQPREGQRPFGFNPIAPLARSNC